MSTLRSQPQPQRRCKPASKNAETPICFRSESLIPSTCHHSALSTPLVRLASHFACTSSMTLSRHPYGCSRFDRNPSPSPSVGANPSPKMLLFFFDPDPASDLHPEPGESAESQMPGRGCTTPHLTRSRLQSNCAAGNQATTQTSPSMLTKTIVLLTMAAVTVANAQGGRLLPN